MKRMMATLALALVLALAALPVAQAQQPFAHGAVVALQGTPHLWIADAQGVLHWGGDTRALAGKYINWGDRTTVSLERLRTLPMGDPWLSAGLLKEGDPIYLVKWETEWPLPRLLHIQSIADVELFGINGDNYGNFVLDVATWEARYGISVAGLERGVLPAAVPSAPPPAPQQSECPRVTDLGTVSTPVSHSGAWSSSDCKLDNNRYYDMYAFRISRGAHVVIELSSSAADSFLGLLDGDDLIVDDDSGGGLDARISRTLSAGTYLVIATALDRERTGDYSLWISVQ